LAGRFADALVAYQLVIARNRGPLVERAMAESERLQVIQIAAPGTHAGVIIAMQEKIMLAELAVLLLEEMKLEQLIRQRRAPDSVDGFRPPPVGANPQQGISKLSAASGWARPWVERAFELGLPGLEPLPDGSLGEDLKVTRASFARAIVAGMTDLLDVGVGEGLDIDSNRVDIIIRGAATVLPTKPPVPMAGRLVLDTGLSTAGATLRVEVGWIDEEIPIGILSTSGRGAGSSPRAAGKRALRHAVDLLGDSLRIVLAEDLRQRAVSTRVVDLVIEGPGVTADIDGLVRAMESGLGPIQALIPRKVEAGQARFQVRSATGAFGLARQLSAHGLESAAVEIVQVTAHSLRVVLASPALEG
jgi:hypothetical protein